MQSQTKWSLVGLGVGLVFLWFALRGADLEAAWDVLRHLHLGWTKAVFVGACLFMLFSTYEVDLEVTDLAHLTRIVSALRASDAVAEAERI